MSEEKHTVVNSWPEIKDDLHSFLADTDAWAINELKKARKGRDWPAVDTVVEIMELLHSISHAH